MGSFFLVLTAVGLPIEQSVAILAPVLSIDWLEDRIMTMVNIEGDMLAAGFVEKYQHKKFFK